MPDDLERLWEAPLGGARSWYDQTTPEVQAFLHVLADRIIERGVEPNWAAVGRHLEKQFGGTTRIPTSKLTVADNVRRLVKELKNAG